MKFITLLSLLLTTTLFAKPCGLQGTIDERIKDCDQVKGDFALVTISEKGTEFYKDLKSKLIWGHRIATDFNHYGSQKACEGDVSEYVTLNTLKWRLPTIGEFEEAAVHGMKTALPGGELAYWSSTAVKTKRSRRRRAMPAGVFLWDGAENRTDTGDLKDGASVRCVARE
jgi:hypothetical protein